MKKLVLMSLVLLTMIATSVVFAGEMNALAEVAYNARMDEDGNISAAKAISDAVTKETDKILKGKSGDPAKAAYDARIAEDAWLKGLWKSIWDEKLEQEEVEKRAQTIKEAVVNRQASLARSTIRLAEEINGNQVAKNALETIVTFLEKIPEAADEKKRIKKAEMIVTGLQIALDYKSIADKTNEKKTATEAEKDELDTDILFLGLDIIGKAGSLAFGPVNNALLSSIISGSKGIIAAKKYEADDLDLITYQLDAYCSQGDDKEYRDIAVVMMKNNESKIDIDKAVNALKILNASTGSNSGDYYSSSYSYSLFYGDEIGGFWFSPRGDEIRIITKEGDGKIYADYYCFGSDPLVYSAVKNKIIEITGKTDLNAIETVIHDIQKRNLVFKNIKSAGKSKWTGEIRTIVVGVDKNNNEIATGTTWSDCTIIMSEDKKSFTVSYQVGPSKNKVDITETWTKENTRPPAHELDGFFRVIKVSGMEEEIEGPVVNVSGGSAILASYGVMNSRQAYAAYHGLWQLGTEEWRNLILVPNKGKEWEGEVREINQNIFGSSVGTKWVKATFNMVNDNQINVLVGDVFTVYRRYDLIKEGLDGVWDSSSGEQIAVKEDIGLIIRYGKLSPLGENAVEKGYSQLGTPEFQKLEKDSRFNQGLRWIGEIKLFRFNLSNPDVALGIGWSRCEISMSEDAQTIEITYTTYYGKRVDVYKRRH